MPSLDSKLYQLIINRLDGDKLSDSDYIGHIKNLVKKGIGGFIVFGGNKNDVKEFITELQTFSKVPLFIASDIERGVGQQLEGATVFPCQMAVAAATHKKNREDLKIIEDALQAIALEAIDTGINMPLIPVLDVNMNPDNPIICTRAFSDNPDDVSQYGKIYIRILQEAGLISCAKHFPGHGATSVDSHISLPVISKSYEKLIRTDILPFKKAVDAGVKSIMMGHLSIPEVDNLPATISGKIVTGILRGELDYKGLIMTDALNMHALKNIDNIAVKCIRAGVDILLHPADADLIVQELKGAVLSGDIKEEMIDNALNRIKLFKSGLKNIRITRPDYKKNAALSAQVFDSSVTLLKDSGKILPLGNKEKVMLILSSDRSCSDINPLRNYFTGGPGFFEINKYPADSKAICETVVIALFTDIAAWKGSSGINKDDINKIKQILERADKSIVISFGSPYVLRHFMGADVLIAAYDSNIQAQRSVIKCLKGEMEFSGKLPVNLHLS